MNYQHTTYFFAGLSIVLCGLLVLGYQSSSQEIMAPTMDMDDTNNAMIMDHSMHGMMMDMTSRMEGKTGDELDQIFLEDMIIHHQGAIDMAELLQAGTERPELQTLATAIIEAQTGEIAQMEEWLDEWFQ
jgi:uncharacterized protein (DUF305 family)